MPVDEELTIRAAGPDDEPAILALLGATLGWLPDEHHASFFAWKHRSNPFGPSWAWVAATPDGALAGFRTFLRWGFHDGTRTYLAVRAVDTATHPDHQGKGVFSRLSRHGLEQVGAEGVDFVFNTPNDQSRPGYLKMGWQVVGPVPVAARPAGVVGALRAARSRTAADLWSTPTEVGVAALDALEDADWVGGLIASQPLTARLTTDRSVEYLRWRYGGFAPLCYRALVAHGGMALFRVRRRGRALEATLGELLVPGADHRTAGRLARDVLRATGADYAVAGHVLGRRPAGFATMASQGPVLTWRGITADDHPPMGRWALSVGDLELF